MPFVVLGILVVFWSFPADTITQDLNFRLKEPSAQHYFGTDELGRDLFSRTLHGTRTSLYISFFASGIAVCFGLIVGLLGAMRKFLSPIFLLLADVILSVPAIVLVLLCISLLGSGSYSLILVLSIIYLPLCIRLAYTQTKKIMGNEFILASHSFGASRWWIGTRHLIRPLAAVLIIQWSTLMAVSVQIEASLSFLGVGVRIPEPSLGLLLRDAQRYFREAPWMLFFPSFILIGISAVLFLSAEKAKRRYQ